MEERPMQPDTHTARSTPTAASSPSSRAHLALYLFGLSGGGAQRRTVTLANAFAERGHRVDLVLVKEQGPLRPQVSPRVNVLELSRFGAPGLSTRTPRRVGMLLAAPALVRYLRSERPAVMLSAASHMHLAALLAHRLAGVETRLVLRASNHLSRESLGETRERRFAPWLARRSYARADVTIAVSESVARDMHRAAGIPLEKITTIHNPVVTAELLERAEAPLEHPWFGAGQPPVVLGVGRLVAQKDFPTLLRAFARVRAERPARLLLLGEIKKAKRYRALQELIAELGVADDVRLEGFVSNPLPYMKRSAVFALSSAWEGLPGALIEAMACGCPVVSTDCPGGSAEILQQGALGPLVPVGDDAALADAILALMDEPTDPERLKARAAEFSLDASVDRYLEVLLDQAPRMTSHMGSG
jgi:glycosyltransferase involved in cell wall biosynthesis